MTWNSVIIFMSMKYENVAVVNVDHSFLREGKSEELARLTQRLREVSVCRFSSTRTSNCRVTVPFQELF